MTNGGTLRNSMLKLLTTIIHPQLLTVSCTANAANIVLTLADARFCIQLAATAFHDVTEVGTDSAQIQHSTDSVGGKKAPVEGNLYDPFSPRNDVTKR